MNESTRPPRMLTWAAITLLLIILALWLQSSHPGHIVSVSLYKAHLMALGGWGGYWLDRALFPYDRPHEYIESDNVEELSQEGENGLQVLSNGFRLAMLRRAVIVAACLVCVGLGA